ncbi:transglutaminase domain-containing protein [Rufibacter sp. XAAS-G3-1]|uniref:transglutaminase domain-containing protein n=1 Tax=Rufibacter sp. XAAS-G3-1 TaxID=2729134 RepID=UPI0015E6AFA0|nr:transglutaminase domain-containing protein [Rufibacter sp. XAAS-G3-1]
MPNSTLFNTRSYLTVAFFLFYFTAFGQETPVKFGKVTEEELNMKVYDKDTSAAAVILADYGRSYFTYNQGFKVNFERILRIKILKKTGYDWANMVVPYYQRNSRKELVTNIKGVTYNLEAGKMVKVKMEDKAVFDEKESANWFNKKFTLPTVKEGSVLEIAYTVTSDFIFNLRDWAFQSSIPVVYSEYRASIPQYFEYKQVPQGYEPFVINEALPGNTNFTVRYSGQNVGSGFNSSRTPGGSETINATTVDHRWVMKDVPAIAPEAFITTLNDYVSKIEFELEWERYPNEIPKRHAGNWNDLTEELMADEQFGLQLNRTGFFKNEVAALPATTDTLTRLNTIYEFVKKSVKWNGRGGKYTTNTLRKAFDTKTGNSADVNLLLVSMLRDAGFEAHPVILSTRDNGRVPFSPVLSKFNYVVAHVKVGNKAILMDATDPLMPLGLLPKYCLNGQGWLVSKTASDWVELQALDRTTELVNAELQVLPTGVLNGKVTESRSGLWAVSQRHSVQETGESKYLEKLVSNQNQFERKAPVLQNLKEVHKPFGVQYELTSVGDDQAKDIIYLNPMLLKAQQDNPFKNASRKYPVDFGYPTEEVYICNFTIPEGYAVEEMPKNIVLALPENGGRFTYMLQVIGNRIQVMSKVTISKPVFYAGEYEYLKQFYTQMVAKHAEQIVLKKKG